VEVFPARNGAPSSRLKLRPFELDVQRIHETVHQPSKGCDRRELDDLGVVEVLGKLRECVVVIAGLVPRDELGPSDDRLLAFTEKRTLEIAVAA